MKRVLGKYYAAEDLTTCGWSVFEHTDEISDNRVECFLEQEEAETYAKELNSLYDLIVEAMHIHNKK